MAPVVVALDWAVPGPEVPVVATGPAESGVAAASTLGPGAAHAATTDGGGEAGEEILGGYRPADDDRDVATVTRGRGRGAAVAARAAGHDEVGEVVGVAGGAADGVGHGPGARGGDAAGRPDGAGVA